jgi:hypothetical protein
MSRWIVALPLIAVGVSIGDSRGASAVSVVEPLAGAFTPAQRQLAQAPTRIPKSALTVHLHHHLGRSSKRPAHGPLSAVFAKARSTVVPTVSIGDDNESLRPHSVSTIRIPATVTSSSVAPQAEASSDRGLGRRRDVADAVTNIVVLADTYDDVRMSPMWPEPPPSPAPFAKTELLILFGACGCVAISIYGLVAFNSQHRRTRVGLSRQSRRGRARASSHTAQDSDRVGRQPLIPHQSEASCRGR